MSGDNWQRAKDIFNAALDLEAHERETYLSTACNGDVELRKRVELLLDSYDSDFMEGPLSNADKPNQGHKELGGKLGRYEILRLIGVGGMGEVYLASDDRLGRKVAIKILNEKYEHHESNLQRFIQEAKAASALNHPNILTIHEIGEINGSHFIVSEFVEGKTLREILRERKLQLSEILDITIQIAEALFIAHKAHIVHRDIKPENVIVRDDGYVKVVDFGLAKLLPSRLSLIGLDDNTIRQNQTAQGLILGTVNYMSPEQAKGETVDERTDIFSLGVLLYEMASGSTPFAGGTISETFANLINQPPPRLSQLANVPEELANVVSRMLEKDRGERYSTMNEALAALKRVKDGSAGGLYRGRTSSSNEENLTAAMPRTTGDAAIVTGKTSGIFTSSYRQFALIALIPLALIAAAVAAWFLYPTTTQPKIKSLAVLPLKSLEAGDHILGFGVADAVIRRISQTGALTVRPTSAVKRYVTEDTDGLTAAQQLSVDAVLEGTVQRAGERIRITVNLLRVKDGASLWAERFDTQGTDIFAVQDKVAQQVAARLQLQLDPVQQARLAKRTTANPVAYEYYLKGVYSFNQRRFDSLAREQINTTIELLKKAIEADPQYALAHAKLAHAYAWKGLFVDTDDQPRLLALANEEIGKADALDPQLADTHLARFRILFSEYGGWRIEEAARGILLAQQIDPNVGHEEIADIYLHIGLEDLMDREIRRALEVDPTSDWVKLQMRIFYLLLNRFDDYLLVKNEHFPEMPISPWYFAAKGDFAKAKQVLDEEEKQNPQNPDPTLKAIILAMEGRKRESEALMPEIMKTLNQRNPAYHHNTYDIACMYSLNGNVPEAMKWLRETAAKGNPSYTLFTRDPFLDKIRQSPAFIQFMAELKPQYEKYRGEFQ